MPNEDDAQLKESESRDTSAMEDLLQQSDIPADDLETPPIKDDQQDDALPDKEDKSGDAPPAKEKDDASGSDKQVPEPDKAQLDKLEQKPDETDEEWEKRIEKIQPKKDASPRTKQAIKEIKETAKEERAKRREFEKKAKELEEKISSSKSITPEIEKELTDLRSFKQTFDLESDPEFNRQINDKITQAENHSIELLKSWHLPDSAAKYIQDKGGVLNFRTSTDLMPDSFKNADGSRMTHAQWWKQKIEANLNDAQKEELGDELLGLRQLHRGKQQAIRDAHANRENYIKQRQEETSRATKDWQDRVQAHAQKVLQAYGTVATLKDVPTNATAEEKQAIEKHNANYKKAEATAQKYLTDITPENMVEAAIGAAYATIARDELESKGTELASALKKIGELETQLKEIKDAGKTTHRGEATTTTKKPVQPSQSKISDEEAMTNLINQK